MNSNAFSIPGWSDSQSLGISSAWAGDFDNERRNSPCSGDHCEIEKKSECFNLVCYFKATDHGRDLLSDSGNGFKNCKAAAVFNKDMTKDGGEVQDDSTSENNPALSVSCDDKPAFFDNSSHRYTSLLGTRIQGQTGPHPAIFLPRGALHSGANDQSGPHVANSVLEIDTGVMGSDVQRLTGYCDIWTGAP